jgi:hypothetical protein
VGARRRQAKFGTVILWSDDSPIDLDELGDQMRRFREDRNAELLNLRERLYDQLDYPPDLRGGWKHDPGLANDTQTIPISKAEACIAIRAICHTIEFWSELNRVRERDARALRAYLQTPETRQKPQAFAREMGVVSSTGSRVSYAADLYLKLTCGDHGISVAYEIPSGAAGFAEAKRRPLPNPTPLSNQEAAGVIADWFEVSYELVRTWLKREKTRRKEQGLFADFKVPPSLERRTAS